MLIWRGWGIAVKFAFIGSVIASMLLRRAELISGKQVLVMSFLLTGAVCWLIGGTLAKRSQRSVRDIVDAETGQTIRIRDHHDFFFVPVRSWAFIAWALALTALLGPSPEVADERGHAQTPQITADQNIQDPGEQELVEAQLAAALASLEAHNASATPHPTAALATAGRDLATPVTELPPDAVTQPALAHSAVQIPAAPGAPHAVTAEPVSAPWPAPRNQTSIGGAVTHLDFSDNREFTDHDLARVAAVTSLTHLNISRTGITAGGLAYLKDHPSLQSLRLDGCRVSGVMDRLSTIPTLVTLRAQDAGLTDRDMEFINSIASLTDLRLGGNLITTRGVRRLTDLNNLRAIELYDTHVDEDVLVHLQQLATLAEVDVRDTRLSKAAIMRFEQARPDVTVLHGSNGPVFGAKPGTWTGSNRTGPAGVAFDKALRPEDRHAFTQAELKMVRITTDIHMHAMRTAQYPNGLDEMARTFPGDEQLVDHWGDAYVYLGRGVRATLGPHRAGDRIIILASGKPHAGRRVVYFNDGRIETIPEKWFVAITRASQ